MRVLIVGAGGHGQVVADIVIKQSLRGADITPVGYLDDNPVLHGRALLGSSVLGAVESVGHWPHDAVVVAIGDNAVRLTITELLLQRGEVLVAPVHPDAILGSGASLGLGSVICAGAVLGVGSQVGRGVIVNTCTSVDHDSTLGDYCHLAPGVHTGGSVDIGRGALVGVGASVLPGRRIGDWAIVGAGAVVTCDVPAHATVVGVPAHVITHSRKENG